MELRDIETPGRFFEENLYGAVFSEKFVRFGFRRNLYGAFFGENVYGA